MKQKLVVIILAMFVFLLFAVDDDLTIREYELTSDKIDKNIRIALITDLHSCEYGVNQMEIMDALSALKPDAVLFGGDIADDDMPTENMETLINAAAKEYKCFFVSGNHEHRRGDIALIKQMIALAGVVILEGDCFTLNIKGQIINICGIDDYDIGSRAFDKQLKGTVSGRTIDQYTILLTHRPEEIHQYLNYDYDLILAGHTHGGQWRIPGVINGLVAPDQGFLPEYGGGKYEFGDTVLIVSRGLARESIRVPRIFNPPELVVVDIVPAS